MSDTGNTTTSGYYRKIPANQSDGTLYQYTIVIAAVAILAALTIPFVAHENGMRQASNYNNIDNVITGSIEKKTKRYRIRRSILDAN